MPNLYQRINKLKDNKVIDTEENLCKLYYYYRKTMGISHDEMMKEPIPTVLANLHFIEEENKEQEKHIKSVKK